MEREKDGLFGRLVHFWKEKIGMQREEGIGFWKAADDVENHFAEMGTVAAMTQKEIKGTFWQEESERQMQKKKTMYLIPEMDEVSQGKSAESMEREGKAEQSPQIFLAERFLGETAKEPDGDENTTDKTREKRYIIPAAEEKDMMQKKEHVSDEMQEEKPLENVRREEKTAEPKLDVEQLMKEITKRLWEEREGCGRRLR